jgi:hypothetical protein
VDWRGGSSISRLLTCLLEIFSITTLVFLATIVRNLALAAPQAALVTTK